MNVTVSIIIPTYLRFSLLTKTLESILNQSYLDWQCIIIDDGSDRDTINKTLEFIKNEPRFVFLKRSIDSKKGPSTCRNEGLKKANGKYVQFFDDDDFMYPNLLQEKVDYIEEKAFDVLVTPLDFFSVKENKVISKNKVVSNNILKSYVLGEVSWYVSGPLWRREFLSEIFDESVQALDDWDFNLRNIYKHPNIGYLEKSFQRYNIYGLGNTLSTLAQLGNERQIKSVYYVYKKHFLLLKELKLLDAKLYSRFYVLLVPILRDSLIHKQNVSKEIFRFLILNIKMDIFLKFIKIFIGYFSYRIFNRGYNLVKY